MNDDRRLPGGERRIGERLAGHAQYPTDDRQNAAPRAEIACPEAEAAWLGSVLRMHRTFAVIVITQVADEDLTDPRHRLVLTGIRHVIERSVDPDPVSVLGELRRLGLLTSFLDDKSGGVFLAELYAAAPIPEQASHYLRIVLEHAFRRRVVEAADRLHQLAGTAALNTLRDVLSDEWTALHAQYQRGAAYAARDGEVE